MKKIIKNIEVLDFAAEGKCISKQGEKVVFTKNTAPGDNVDILITRKRKGYSEGRAIHFHRKSDLRTEPFCEHYDYCGCCQWQHVPYSEQLKFKEDQVRQQLMRIGALEDPQVEEIIACDNQVAYRNKLEFSFASQRWLTPEELNQADVKKSPGLGFHISGHFDKVLDINKCHLQEDFSNTIRNWIRDYALSNGISFYFLRKKEGELRSLTIRNTRAGEWMLIIQFGTDLNEKLEKLLQALKQEFPRINSIFYVINKKVNDTFLDQKTILFQGQETISENIHNLNFRIRPKSFFQTNPDQAEKLYSVAAEMCGDLKDKTVYDLYTGTGTIALTMAKSAKKIIGIESVDQAIEDANFNAAQNGISNVEFFCGDMRELLTVDFCKKNGFPDIIICDPPRDGMHKDIIEVLLEIEAKRIIYISCKPSTQARDLSLLSEKYDVGKIQPVDMFPQTHHVENILQLNLR
ncbi:MAG: 23S rRNA (uracil(1939)-C(5))-methyltransferase RlmD [Cytophagales bacterium]